MNILITGGTRGIGHAIVKELLQNGHFVLAISKNQKNLALLKKEFPEVLIEQCDISNSNNIVELKNKCVEKEFKADIIVLCAGIFIEGNLATANPNDFRKTLEINLISHYYFVQTFLEDLKSSHYARIIMIGSTASLERYAIGPLYSVAKWGLKGFAVNLREELMKDYIGVTLLNPGSTLTDLWEGEELELDRILEPKDIAILINSIIKLSRQAVVEEITVRPMLGDIHQE